MGGTIVFDGKPVDIKSPHYSKKIGIQAVYQDITLAAHLSVGENFFLGNLPMRTPLTVDWKKVHSTASELLASLDLRIDSRTLLMDLPVAKQEMVAIAKAMYEKSKLMIFDEPTALLANEECEELYKIIGKLKSDGIGIIYISHRMEEIFRICDTVTILKDGRYVSTLPIGETDENKLISLMVGRKIEEMYSIEHHPMPEVVLSAKKLSSKGIFEGIDFDLHRGEILGMFGLVGSGRTDIVSAIFGATAITSGEVHVFGKLEKIRKPRDAIRARYRTSAGKQAHAGARVAAFREDKHEPRHLQDDQQIWFDQSQGRKKQCRSLCQGNGDENAFDRGQRCEPCRAAISRRSSSANGWPANQKL